MFNVREWPRYYQYYPRLEKAEIFGFLDATDKKIIFSKFKQGKIAK